MDMSIESEEPFLVGDFELTTDPFLISYFSELPDMMMLLSGLSPSGVNKTTDIILIEIDMIDSSRPFCFNSNKQVKRGQQQQQARDYPTIK
jgi:hypothetical protein